MSIVAHKKRLSDVSRFLCALINLAMCKSLIGIGKCAILLRVTLLAAQAWEQSLLPDDDP